jgi:hypothetical protein
MRGRLSCSSSSGSSDARMEIWGGWMSGTRGASAAAAGGAPSSRRPTGRGDMAVRRRGLVGDLGELYGALAPRLERMVQARRARRGAGDRGRLRVRLEPAGLPRPPRGAGRRADVARRDRGARGAQADGREQRELLLEAQVEQTSELLVPAWTPSPHEHAEWREQLELLRRLPARQQRFLRRRRQDSGTRRLPRATCLTRRTVEWQILRARPGCEQREWGRGGT